MRLTASGAYSRPTPVPKLPAGLMEIMEDLSRNVLRHNPPDVYEYCAEHMSKLLELRDGRAPKKILTIEEKIARAQEVVRKRAEERRKKYDEQMELFLQSQMGNESHNPDSILSVQDDTLASISKAPVHHENDLAQNLEVEVFHGPIGKSLSEALPLTSEHANVHTESNVDQTETERSLDDEVLLDKSEKSDEVKSDFKVQNITMEKADTLPTITADEIVTDDDSTTRMVRSVYSNDIIDEDDVKVQNIAKIIDKSSNEIGIPKAEELSSNDDNTVILESEKGKENDNNDNMIKDEANNSPEVENTDLKDDLNKSLENDNNPVILESVIITESDNKDNIIKDNIKNSLEIESADLNIDSNKIFESGLIDSTQSFVETKDNVTTVLTNNPEVKDTNEEEFISKESSVEPIQDSVVVPAGNLASKDTTKEELMNNSKPSSIEPVLTDTGSNQKEIMEVSKESSLEPIQDGFTELTNNVDVKDTNDENISQISSIEDTQGTGTILTSNLAVKDSNKEEITIVSEPTIQPQDTVSVLTDNTAVKDRNKEKLINVSEHLIKPIQDTVSVLIDNLAINDTNKDELIHISKESSIEPIHNSVTIVIDNLAIKDSNKELINVSESLTEPIQDTISLLKDTNEECQDNITELKESTNAATIIRSEENTDTKETKYNETENTNISVKFQPDLDNTKPNDTSVTVKNVGEINNMTDQVKKLIDTSLANSDDLLTVSTEWKIEQIGNTEQQVNTSLSSQIVPDHNITASLAKHDNTVENIVENIKDFENVTKGQETNNTTVTNTPPPKYELIKEGTPGKSYNTIAKSIDHVIENKDNIDYTSSVEYPAKEENIVRDLLGPKTQEPQSSSNGKVEININTEKLHDYDSINLHKGHNEVHLETIEEDRLASEKDTDVIDDIVKEEQEVHLLGDSAIQRETSNNENIDVDNTVDDERENSTIELNFVENQHDENDAANDFTLADSYKSEHDEINTKSVSPNKELHELRYKHYEDNSDTLENVSNISEPPQIELETASNGKSSSLEDYVNDDVSGSISDVLNTSQSERNRSMDLETAAVTIQKVFRTFLFKSRGSTFEDSGNGEPNLTDEDTEKEDTEFQKALTNPNKERRTLGISRMDTVLQTVNEEKSLSLSTDDSSTLSSAATTIQAHVRGFLVRNKLNSYKTASSTSLVNSDGPSTHSLEAEAELPKNSKTVLNIHIVPEGGHYLSRDESILTSMDLSLDGSPPSSINLHPLGYDKSERRKQLKREDAIQSMSPPSNNSGKLSEDVDSVKEIIVNETTEQRNQDVMNDIQLDIEPETSDNSLTKSTTIETVIEMENLNNTDLKSSADSERRKRSLTRMSSDESDVVTPFVQDNIKQQENLNNTTKLLHSGEFHDVVLPTKISRSDTSVVREFKNVLVKLLLWNN